LWELRAAGSLARLWAEQGNRRKARDLLVPIYNWFTEGFETADLQDARMLLDQLT
jgi:predicted ATPase